MISLSNLSKGLVFAALLILSTTLSGCVTSKDVLFNAVSTPMRTGKYEVQYLIDGKWTTFGAGSLALVNGQYTWDEDKEAASLLNWSPSGLRLTLVDAGNRYFIIIIAIADLRNPIWVGNYMYGIARRSGDVFLYEFPSCFDLMVSEGFADSQIEKIGTYECLYSRKTPLTSALTTYAKRAVLWKRLAPSSH
jgi:hypothetical protein